MIASSAMEGIVVEQTRAESIVRGADQRLRVRNEKELTGYRDALDFLFQNDPGDLSVGLVVDRHAVGTSSVRFVPTSHQDTPLFTSELVDRYGIEQGTGRHHSVLLVGLFALDFLTIHPFVDGNGRLSRLFSRWLLSEAGYGVGRSVSLEGVIYERRDAYCDALAASTAAWQEGAHDPWPWLRFFVDVVADAYEAFAARAADHQSGITEQERVRNYVLNHAGPSFEMADVQRALPGVSDQTVRLVLRELKNEGLVSPSGVGRGAKWVRVDQ